MQILKQYLKKALLGTTCAIGGAILGSSTDLLKEQLWPWLYGVGHYAEDVLDPISEDELIGVNLVFYIPPEFRKGHSSEGLSASIPAKQCLKGKHQVIRNFDDTSDDHQTNAIVHITCRPSGRLTVSLTPQDGKIVEIYDGIFNDGDRASFPGVQGSYHAGILTMHWLNSVKPEGPLLPVNKCQIDNSCAPKDFTTE
ncbi:hypothetical protein K3169_14070 [Pseudomonas phytophila]|uniref:Uncharacterized protein n=1 Tax=Pseudomonas phytophila TaxID=2867264 RepID=A0ABY6FME4_9PSED|nr:hypothetical protein [Pseudomonas phytophila]UXZ98911.1 hypothetical protein K3169_14070 [Pseudomonas phytophila]